MNEYNGVLAKIKSHGVDKLGRNGWTRSLFAMQLRFDMREGRFPAVTTKKLAFDLVKGELLWFLSGSTDDHDLKRLCGNVARSIWTDNAEDPKWVPKARFPGDLGRIYGAQWRSWSTKNPNACVDQIANVIAQLQKDPNDRRMVVTAWNPGELGEMSLPPCHMLFQFYVVPAGKHGQNPSVPGLCLHMVQRSCDMFLGVPFNIASYALLLSMVAHVVGMEPNELVITLNDAHIYHEHFDAVNLQLQRGPYAPPKLALNSNVHSLEDFRPEHIALVDYKHHPAIKAKMIV